MKAGRILCLAAALCVLLTGCNLDVESFLRPPRAQGAQQAVHAALDTYIHDTGDSSLRYTLKYPSEGDYTSAFVLCDSRGFPVEDSAAEAELAVAFYTLDPDRQETHVNLLRLEGEEWLSVGDAVGYGSDIRQVAFGDLDGDGLAELLTGWSTYNSQSHRLGIFSMVGELPAVATDRVYTRLQVGDITGSGRDSLLLLHIGSGQQVTAALEQLEQGHLTTLDTVRLDGNIRTFGEVTLCTFDEVPGVYIEAEKSAGTVITELVVYEDGRLRAPFYDPVSNQTSVTARPTGLTARDVDGDGIIEVPHCTPLPGYDATAAATTAWLTVWRTYDYTADMWTDRLHTVVNATDGYLVTLEGSGRERVTTRYTEDTHTLELLNTADRRVWMRLSVGEDATGGEHTLVLESTAAGQLPCTVWYDADVLDEEKVRYMVIRWG